VAAALFALSGPAAADAAALDLGEAFCRARLASDEAATEALLTPSLRDAVEVAQDRNAVIAEANPGEKPPFGDGIPYQSFMDAADTCLPGEPVEKASAVELPVRYAFDGAPNAGWTDTLVLVRSGADYLIDDIVFAGSPDGSDPVHLRSVLLDAFDR
jgi:hypothetical protein